MKRVFKVLLGLSAGLVLLAVACGDSEPKVYTGVGPEDPPLDDNKLYTADVEVKSKTGRFGVNEFSIRLYLNRVPKNVRNFIFLSRDDFYDGVTFHSIEPGVIVHSGDPYGTGTGGPGYTVEDEFSPDLRFDRAGMVGMANSGPNTAGSRWFITLGPAPHLDGLNPDGSPKDCADPAVTCHTVIGTVIAGMGVVERLIQGAEIARILIVASAPR